MKVAIVGLGHVGSSAAMALVMDGAFSEVTLVSRRLEWAEAEAMDLRHAACMGAPPMRIEATTLENLADADVVVVTASVPRPTNAASRTDLAAGNGAMMREMVPLIAKRCPRAVLIMVSNPVEAMTTYALALSGFGPQRVIGTGTLIDSARWRAGIAARVGVHPSDIRAYVLGEHGAGIVPVVSGMNIGGEWPTDPMGYAVMAQQGIREAGDIMRIRGYTNHAIARAVAMIAGSIARDARRTMPVSVLCDGYAGIRDVCLSLPCVIGRRGVERILHPEMDDAETAAFAASAQWVRAALAACRGE